MYGTETSAWCPVMTEMSRTGGAGRREVQAGGNACIHRADPLGTAEANIAWSKQLYANKKM